MLGCGVGNDGAESAGGVVAVASGVGVVGVWHWGFCCDGEKMMVCLPVWDILDGAFLGGKYAYVRGTIDVLRAMIGFAFSWCVRGNCLYCRWLRVSKVLPFLSQSPFFITSYNALP